KPDIVLGNNFNPFSPSLAPVPSQVYINPGSGVFNGVTPAVLLDSSKNGYSVAVGDLDGDAKADIVLGNTNDLLSGAGHLSQVYMNPGGGDFSAVTPAPIAGSGGPTLSVKLGDLNGDGKLDLLVANNLRQAQVFLNNGRG